MCKEFNMKNLGVWTGLVLVTYISWSGDSALYYEVYLIIEFHTFGQ